MKKYIDRDALVEYAHCQYGMVTASDIMGFPTADVQPVKHGHWVEKEAYEEDRQMGFNFQIVCSNCDEQNSVLYFDENSEPTEKYFMRTPWCPWCGARMDGDSK